MKKLDDKYLPRNLNGHARDLLNIFQTVSFKQLRESKDRYPETAFWSSPLNWLFLAYDKDFQVFLLPAYEKFLEQDSLSISDMGTLFEGSSHDKEIFNEVNSYLFKILKDEFRKK